MTWADFERSAYKASRNWDMQPSEFWGISPQEWWWEYDMRVAEAEEVKKAIGKNKTTATPDWDRLRKLHKAKMNGNASTDLN